jgi:hypothetical protein
MFNNMRKLNDMTLDEWASVDIKNTVVLAKRSARNSVRYALELGKLQKLPCEYLDCRCPEVEAHHPDYTEPLSVLWLCHKHHSALHYPIYPYLRL